MKKLLICLCLLLSLLLVGCSSDEEVAPETTAPEATAEPAATAEPVEKPALNTPITLEAYQKAYETLLTTVVPETTVSWHSATTDSGDTCIAVVNDAAVSVMLMLQDGVVSEVAVLLQADMSEEALSYFMSMAGYAGAALLQDDEVPPLDACDHFMTELYTVFSAILEGTQPESIYGLPGMININMDESGAYQYYLILQTAQ